MLRLQSQVQHATGLAELRCALRLREPLREVAQLGDVRFGEEERVQVSWAVKSATCDVTGETHEWRENLCGDIACRRCQRSYSASRLAGYVTELMRVIKTLEKESDGQTP